MRIIKCYYTGNRVKTCLWLINSPAATAAAALVARFLRRVSETRAALSQCQCRASEYPVERCDGSSETWVNESRNGKVTVKRDKSR